MKIYVKATMPIDTAASSASDKFLSEYKYSIISKISEYDDTIPCDIIIDRIGEILTRLWKNYIRTTYSYNAWVDSYHNWKNSPDTVSRDTVLPINYRAKFSDVSNENAVSIVNSNPKSVELGYILYDTDNQRLLAEFGTPKKSMYYALYSKYDDSKCPYAIAGGEFRGGHRWRSREYIWGK